MRTKGRPRKLDESQVSILVQIVEADPLSTISEVVAEFERRSNIKVHAGTVRSALKRAGIERVQPPARLEAEADASAATAKKRYGYTEAHRRHLPEQTYPSCLTDAEWALVEHIFNNEEGRGRPPRYARRALVDACCYVVRTGCAWRLLPRNFPRWPNVYRTFRRWSEQGKFERMNDVLRAMWREREERPETPTAAIIDAQSTRASPQGGDIGFDAGKKIKGRKRHLVVDTLGLLLAVSVTSANVQDRDGAHPVVEAAMAKCPGIRTLYADGGYTGQCAQTVSQTHGIKVNVVRSLATSACWARPDQLDMFNAHAKPEGFVLKAKRWIVERTHAWNERARRLVMHHDRVTDVSEAWVWLAEARILLRRLTT
jgi:transposase